MAVDVGKAVGVLVAVTVDADCRTAGVQALHIMTIKTKPNLGINSILHFEIFFIVKPIYAH